MKKCFSYQQFTLQIELTPLYIVKTITLFKNSQKVETITDAFIITQEKVDKLKKMLSFFDDKTKNEIKQILEEF